MQGFCFYFHIMQKTSIIIAIIVGAVVLIVSYALFSSGTSFTDKKSKDIYIPSGTNSLESVLTILSDSTILSKPAIFKLLAAYEDYEDHIQSGKYTILAGISTFSILKKLRNGKTDDVKLVINKLRTKENLASLLGRKLEIDSSSIMNFFNNPDSVAVLGLDTNNIVTLFIPNTYNIDWTISVSRFMKRMKIENHKFWNESRSTKLNNLGLTKEQVYILASIVEEETNKHDEKPLISSVYLNRLNRNMPLGADPTIKYALRDFKIKRLTFAHIRNSSSSPYNTYTNKGLPPGPICTPSSKSIDGVLNSKSTDYIFFCAKADFSGYHSFATNETDHFKNARAYQKALDSLRIH
jgi:UPF0755 protein